MADLIVLGFENRKIAEEVFELGISLKRQELLDLEDAALTWLDDNGRLRIEQALSATGPTAVRGGVNGALWGTLIGLLFLDPFAGMAIGGVAGTAAGAAVGALRDIGIDDNLIREIGQQLQPGKAAVFALLRRSSPDRIADDLKQYRPTVIHTTLYAECEDELVQALQR
jgi:uncharacterized membrane protein